MAKITGYAGLPTTSPPLVHAALFLNSGVMLNFYHENSIFNGFDTFHSNMKEAIYNHDFEVSKEIFCKFIRGAEVEYFRDLETAAISYDDSLAIIGNVSYSETYFSTLYSQHRCWNGYNMTDFE
jgi:hypothetical protein